MILNRRLLSKSLLLKTNNTTMSMRPQELTQRKSKLIIPLRVNNRRMRSTKKSFMKQFIKQKQLKRLIHMRESIHIIMSTPMNIIMNIMSNNILKQFTLLMIMSKLNSKRLQLLLATLISKKSSLSITITLKNIMMIRLMLTNIITIMLTSTHMSMLMNMPTITPTNTTMSMNMSTSMSTQRRKKPQ